MSETLVIVQQDPELTVSVSDASLTISTTNLANPAVVESLDNIADVDTTTFGKVNGSVLVFNTITNKWTSTTTLSAQNMEGGEF